MKIIHLIAAFVFLVPSAFGAERNSRTEYSAIGTHVANPDRAAAMVGRNQYKLRKLLSAKSDEIFNGNPDQAFRLAVDSTVLYVVPLEYAAAQLFLTDSCAVGVMDKSEQVLDARSTFNAEELSWTCDGLSGIGFRRSVEYPTIIDVLVVYQGRPPSNKAGDLFSYPVKLTYDMSRRALSVDQELSRYLRNNNVNDVKVGFKLLSTRRRP